MRDRSRPARDPSTTRPGREDTSLRGVEDGEDPVTGDLDDVATDGVDG